MRAGRRTISPRTPRRLPVQCGERSGAKGGAGCPTAFYLLGSAATVPAAPSMTRMSPVRKSRVAPFT